MTRQINADEIDTKKIYACLCNKTSLIKKIINWKNRFKFSLFFFVHLNQFKKLIFLDFFIDEFKNLNVDKSKSSLDSTSSREQQCWIIRKFGKYW